MRTYGGISLTRISDPALRRELHEIDLFLRQLSQSVGGNSQQGDMSIPTIIQNQGVLASNKAVPIAGVTAIPGQAKQILVDSTGRIIISGTVTVGTVDTELPAAVALSADDVASPTAPAVAAFPHWYDGATWDRARGDTANGLDVDLTRWIGSAAPTVGQKAMAASLPVVVASDQTAIPISGTITVSVGKVDDAAFAVAVDSVLPMGALADEAGTDSVDEGDVGIPRMTLDRKLLVRVVGATDSSRLAVNASGEVSVAYGSGSFVVTGTVSAVQSGTWNVNARTNDSAGTAIGSTVVGGKTGLNQYVINGAAADAVNIQDGGNTITVDGTVIVTNADLTTIAGAVRAEDTSSSSGHTGIGALVIQTATPINTAAEGDYSFLQMSAGRLWVDGSGVTLTVASHAVTNAGTFVVQVDGAALTSLQLIDDIVVAQGTALGSTKIALMGGSVTTAAPTFTTGQINQLSLTTSGALRVDLGATGANTTAVKVDGSAVTQPVSGTVAVTNADLTTIAGAVRAEDSPSASAHTGIGALAIQTATPINTAAEADYSFLQMSVGRLWVDASGVTLTVAAHAVTNAGTFVVQIDGAALTSLQLIDDIVVAQGTALGSTKVALMGGSVTTAAPTFTTGQINQLSLTTSGALRVDLGATGANGTAILVDNQELPAATALADTVANPTTTVVAAYNVAKDQNATTYSRVSSELANANTLDHTSDRGVHISDVVKYHHTADLSTVNTTYNNATTNANSQDIDCSRFRKFTLSFNLTRANSPTDIQFIIQLKDSDGAYYDYRNYFWGQLIYTGAAVGASGFLRAFTGDCIFPTMRLRVVATGTTASNTFTLADAKITLKN